MAQDTDDAQKTEDPSQRRLQRARDQGEVAQSREVNTWFMLGTSALLVLFLGPSIAHSIGRALVAFVDPQQFLSGDGIAWHAVAAVISQVGLALAVPFALMLVAATTGSLVQTGFLFATEKLGFDLSRCSPAAGFGRMFSTRTMVETLKSLAKIVAVAVVTGMMLQGEIGSIPFIGMTIDDLPAEIERLVLRLLLGALIVLTALAGADYFYQRLSMLRTLRMTRREIREEVKQSEGDPLIKGRLRQIRMDRARRRMMAAVPGASVVITNPTHFAVALKYDMGDSGAPRLVAKGADLIAQRIRDIANENGVPVVENPPLARALYAGVEIDREIPPEHYKAVAEIIGYVFRLKGKLRPQ